MEKTITVREYLHSLNILEEDRDVYVDGIDGIAVVGGEIQLTPLGMKKFGPVLDMEMEGSCIIGSDEDYDLLDDGKGNLCLAWEFLSGMAGMCSCSDYDAWFEGDDAELV